MRTRLSKAGRRGFTMAELLIVVVCIGLLAAVAVPTINGVRASLTDSTKVRNADKLNEYVSAVFNGGVDTSAYTDSASAIKALQGGVTIPSTMENGTAIVIRLEKDLNPEAYEFTAGGTGAAPRFKAKTGFVNVRP